MSLPAISSAIPPIGLPLTNAVLGKLQGLSSEDLADGAKMQAILATARLCVPIDLEGAKALAQAARDQITTQVTAKIAADRADHIAAKASTNNKKH